MNSEPVKKVQKKKVLVDTAIVDDDDNNDDDIDNDNDPEWNPEDADWNGKLWNVQMDVDFIKFFPSEIWHSWVFHKISSLDVLIRDQFECDSEVQMLKWSPSYTYDKSYFLW